MERTFYKPLMNAGSSSFQIFVPKDVVEALKAKERDELEIVVKKTGRVVPKTERFKKKESNNDKGAGTPAIDKLDYELQGMINQAKIQKQKGVSIEEIKALVDQNPKWSYVDFPESVRKELEK